jgi:alanine racemase
MPEHPLNHQQLVAFTAARALFPGVEGSLSASSGLFLGEDWHADWGRPGAALYGLQPRPDRPNPMSQVVRLEGRILQVRDVEAGDTVGYGATHRVVGQGRLAIVAAGYADGLFRSLSNRWHGFIGGSQVPMVGRVSMDLTIFDVTGVPSEMARPGAHVELIGPSNTVNDMGRAAGTIGYEVLTALGRRYCRRYLGGPTDRSV